MDTIIIIIIVVWFSIYYLPILFMYFVTQNPTPDDDIMRMKRSVNWHRFYGRDARKDLNKQPFKSNVIRMALQLILIAIANAFPFKLYLFGLNRRNRMSFFMTFFEVVFLFQSPSPFVSVKSDSTFCQVIGTKWGKQKLLPGIECRSESFKCKPFDKRAEHVADYYSSICCVWMNPFGDSRVCCALHVYFGIWFVFIYSRYVLRQHQLFMLIVVIVWTQQHSETNASVGSAYQIYWLTVGFYHLFPSLPIYFRRQIKSSRKKTEKSPRWLYWMNKQHCINTA